MEKKERERNKNYVHYEPLSCGNDPYEGWRSWVNWYKRSGWLFSVRFSFYKIKITKLNFFKKIRNWTETGSNRPVSVRFFRTKPVQTGLARFFRFDSIFSVWLGFFSDLARFFFQFFLFRFSFFGFRLIKPKPNRTSQFFQNFNRFFHSSVFSVIFFSGFLDCVVFLLTPNNKLACIFLNKKIKIIYFLINSSQPLNIQTL